MLRDLRLAITSLRSWRFGAITAVLTLAIGIGTATSMYALVRITLTRTIPDVEDLLDARPCLCVEPGIGYRAVAADRCRISTLLTTASSFESVGAYTSEDSEIMTGDRPATISLGEVSAGFFPAYARACRKSAGCCSPSDFRDGAQVVVVSDRDLAHAVPGTHTRRCGPDDRGHAADRHRRAASELWLLVHRHRRRRVDSDASGPRGRRAPGVGACPPQARCDLGRPQPRSSTRWHARRIRADCGRGAQSPSSRTSGSAASGGFAMMFGPAARRASDRLHERRLHAARPRCRSRRRAERQERARCDTVANRQAVDRRELRAPGRWRHARRGPRVCPASNRRAGIARFRPDAASSRYPSSTLLPIALRLQHRRVSALRDASGDPAVAARHRHVAERGHDASGRAVRGLPRARSDRVCRGRRSGRTRRNHRDVHPLLHGARSASRRSFRRTGSWRSRCQCGRPLRPPNACRGSQGLPR